jgi:hypothetical protein
MCAIRPINLILLHSMTFTFSDESVNCGSLQYESFPSRLSQTVPVLSQNILLRTMFSIAALITSIWLKTKFQAYIHTRKIIGLYNNWKICIVGGGINVHSTLRPPVAYCASPGWLWWWRNRWNDWQGKPKYSEKTCPSAALSTKNPTCCPYANPSRRGGKPASNRWATARPRFVQ